MLDENGVIWMLVRRFGVLANQASAGNTFNLAFTNARHSSDVSITAASGTWDNPTKHRALTALVARPWDKDDEAASMSTVLRLDPLRADFWDAPNGLVVDLTY